MANEYWQKAKKYPAGVDVVVQDGKPHTVTFRAEDGTRVMVSSFYGLTVSVEAPPPTETKYRVSGTVLGVPVQEQYDDRFAATQRAQALSEATRDAAVAVDEVEIPF